MTGLKKPPLYMDGGLYVVAFRVEGPVKIGITSDFEKRLKYMQGPLNPFGRLRLSYAFCVEHCITFHGQEFPREAMLRYESIAHRSLQKYKETGEWFNISCIAAVEALSVMMPVWMFGLNGEHILRKRDVLAPSLLDIIDDEGWYPEPFGAEARRVTDEVTLSTRNLRHGENPALAHYERVKTKSSELYENAIREGVFG